MEYVNLNHLRYFYAVAKTGSYSKASEKLYIQQPALSKTVKNLEYDLDLKLFQKSGRGVELTPEGEFIFSKCDEIFNTVEDILHFSKQEEIPLKETFTIYTNDVIASRILPRAYDELEFTKKGIRPKVIVSTSAEMIEKMNKDERSVGLFFHTPKTGKQFILEKIPVTFNLVIAKKYANSQRIITSFIGSREIDDEKNYKFPTVTRMRKIWPDTKITISTNSLLSHYSLVRQGLGVAILPNFLEKKDLKRGSFVELLEEQQFNLKVIYKKDYKQDHLIVSLKDYLDSFLQ